MKIMVVSMTLPYPPVSGCKIRVLNLIKQLSLNHSITLICLADSDADKKNAEKMKQWCDYVETVVLKPGAGPFLFRMLCHLPALLSGTPLVVLNKRSRTMAKKIKAILKKEDFDCIQFEWLQMAQYMDSGFEQILKKKGVLIEHDVAYIPLKRRAETYSGIARPVWKMEYHRMLRYEKEQSKKFRKIITMSEDDKRRLHELERGLSIDVIPNGVDCDFYAEKKANKEVSSILYTGWMRHDPNLDGIIFFLGKIFPLILSGKPETRFYIIGANPPKALKRAAGEFSGNVVVLGFVHDVREYLRKAKVSVVPLRVGGGTRLKILESMASETAVVSTSVGCEGIKAVNGRDLLVADTPELFASHVIDLLTDNKKRKIIENSALRLVRERYDWKIIANEMEKVYTGL